MNILKFDFTAPVAEREPSPAEIQQAMRVSIEKAIVRGLPPDEAWQTLVGLASSGVPFEFIGTFRHADIAGLQQPEAAVILDAWRMTLDNIRDVMKAAYNLVPDVRMAHFITALHSVDQQFITTLPALHRQTSGASKQFEQLIGALRQLGLICEH